MPAVELDLDLPAPPEEVWAVVSDLSRYPDWVTVHRAFPDGAPSSPAEGDSFRQELTVAGQDFEVTWTVEAADAPHRLAFRGTGPAGTKAFTEYRLSEQGGGTHFDYVNEFDLPGGPLGAIAGRAVEPQSRGEAERSLEQLRALF